MRPVLLLTLFCVLKMAALAGRASQPAFPSRTWEFVIETPAFPSTSETAAGPAKGSLGPWWVARQPFYAQSSDAACAVSCIRNIEALSRGGKAARAESAIAQLMANAIGVSPAVFQPGGSGLELQKSRKAFNAALAPLGLQATSVQYNSVEEFVALVTEAANRRVAFIAITDPPFSADTVTSFLPFGPQRAHVVALWPHFAGERAGRSQVKVLKIDSGVRRFGRASVTLLPPEEAAYVPINYRGASGNIWRVEPRPPAGPPAET